MSTCEPANIRASIDLEGVYWTRDLKVGENVVQFLKAGLPYVSATGLKLVKDNILEQPAIKELLRSTFERSLFSYFRGYGHLQGQAYTISRSYKHEPFGGCLAIQLWMRDSEAIFHHKSHKVRLPAKPSANGLLEVSQENIKDPIESQHVIMPDGGWAIVDPRCVFTIEKGFVIIAVFAIEALISTWKSHMVYPDTPDIRKLMEEMEDQSIGFNIKLNASQ
ncbi:Hypothetical protein R9X50_00407500 [Acrodontium crateriforme]|uniref:Uncharacterized protein n=1 Tax=Acrodontium crateriforme TaxID=150365 RepID=A0AAQ3M6W9_9PEZI|nr:Hypothetical protein R9X50_00407500 [Acrodontium crateriforme]